MVIFWLISEPKDSLDALAKVSERIKVKTKIEIDILGMGRE